MKEFLILKKKCEGWGELMSIDSTNAIDALIGCTGKTK